MTCGLDSYPKLKYKTVRLINNYLVNKQTMRAAPEKEGVVFKQTSSDTKTSKTNKKGESDCFHCGKQNHWTYEFPQLSEKERDELNETKEKGGYIHTQVSEVVKDNIYLENGISMLVNYNLNQRKKRHPARI